MAYALGVEKRGDDQDGAGECYLFLLSGSQQQVIFFDVCSQLVLSSSYLLSCHFPSVLPWISTTSGKILAAGFRDRFITLVPCHGVVRAGRSGQSSILVCPDASDSMVS